MTLTASEVVEVRTALFETARQMKVLAERIVDVTPTLPSCLDADCHCLAEGLDFLATAMLPLAQKMATDVQILNHWAATTRAAHAAL